MIVVVVGVGVEDSTRIQPSQSPSSYSSSTSQMGDMMIVVRVVGSAAVGGSRLSICGGGAGRYGGKVIGDDQWAASSCAVVRWV